MPQEMIAKGLRMGIPAMAPRVRREATLRPEATAPMAEETPRTEMEAKAPLEEATTPTGM